MLCNNGSNNFPRFFVVPLSWDCELWGAGCVICRYPHYLFTPSAIFTFNRWYTFSPFTSSAGNLSLAINSKNQTALLNQNLLSYKPRWVVPAHLTIGIGSKKDTSHQKSKKIQYICQIWHFHASKSEAVEFQGGARKAPRTEIPRIATRTKLQEEVTSNLTHLSTSSSTSIIFTSNMGTNLLQTKFVNMI